MLTAIDIYKDEVIAIFKGKILSNAQAKLRAENHTDSYFISMLDGSILDSMHVNCFAKYANDAEGSLLSGFTNNAKITLDENQQVCLVALRDIKTDEEIFCSYGKRYWRNR